MTTLHKEFKLYKQGQLISGTHAESPKRALEAMFIPPEDIVVESTSGNKLIFRHNGETHVLEDVGYFR